MIDIRPILPHEIEECKKLVPHGYDEPNWSQTYVALDDGVLAGLVGIEQIVIAEPLYVKDGHALVLHGLCTWLDGFMRAIGVKKWLAFVSDDHGKFQQLLKRHMPVTFYRERPGLWFTRKF